MPLSITDRITILRMRGFGDQIRSYEAVANLFNDIRSTIQFLSLLFIAQFRDLKEQVLLKMNPDLEDQKLLATTIQH